MNEGIPNYSRRAVIRILGATAVGANFAGCLGSPSENSDATRRPDETYVEDPPNYDGWFDGVNNYSGTVDRRGKNEVIVRVGAGSRGKAFDPPAVMISPGTTIVWEWTGDGGTHNVSAENGDFESEYSDSSGHTYDYTFEDTRVFKYVCEPHRSAGMKGAIVVE
ncbi:halocyanin domain-containing protein [Haladaptatus halobius]|uniref:halocyanin domain-containing protein n=1 Tax=Haladaptatus halobius TaxID=2884875 RepID=UPI001D0AF2B3|nr:halocyanin domain-containing protein [Haladaptatus halobius]